MLGYTLVGTNDLPKALEFYDRLFDAVGVKRLWDMGDRGASWGVSMGVPSFGVCLPANGEPASAGNGAMIALAMDQRAKVDAIYARAMEIGGTDEGPPGIRPPEEYHFYAAYFRDLDGNKLCAFKMGKE
jgi:catechol 2,3-dioxygenase-like lactoylglutathione lyase family enzyme